MDDFLSVFPPKLAKKIRDAGVTSPSGLIEALQVNPGLDREFTRYAEKHPEVIFSLTMSALVEQFVMAENPSELLGVYLAAPPEIRPLLPMAVAEMAALAEREGRQDAADDLRDRLNELDQMIDAMENPIVVAIGEFLSAPDEQAARDVYFRRRRILQTIYAQRLVDSDELLAGEPVPAGLQARRDLLREFRALGSAYAPRHRLHKG